VHTTDTELALAAAQAGAALVRSRYAGALTRIAKSPIDFATDVDLASEATILGVLKAARPDDRYVGEESGVTGADTSGREWLVDPLCGTLNYAAGTPLASVNVALRRDAETLAAAAADPIADEVFWTDGRRYFVRAAGADLPARPSGRCAIVDLNVDPPYPNGDRFRAAWLLDDAAFTAVFRPRVLSTTLALAWVAAGRRAGYVTDGHLQDSVHFAAGIAVCQAAGCIVTDLLGEPLHRGAGGLVAAADAAAHQQLIKLIGRRFAPTA
jgi:myo-inositol-1(or 4)-monophosphatase